MKKIMKKLNILLTLLISVGGIQLKALEKDRKVKVEDLSKKTDKKDIKKKQVIKTVKKKPTKSVQKPQVATVSGPSDNKKYRKTFGTTTTTTTVTQTPGYNQVSSEQELAELTPEQKEVVENVFTHLTSKKKGGLSDDELGLIIGLTVGVPTVIAAVGAYLSHRAKTARTLKERQEAERLLKEAEQIKRSEVRPETVTTLVNSVANVPDAPPQTKKAVNEIRKAVAQEFSAEKSILLREELHLELKERQRDLLNLDAIEKDRIEKEINGPKGHKAKIAQVEAEIERKEKLETESIDRENKALELENNQLENFEKQVKIRRSELRQLQEQLSKQQDLTEQLEAKDTLQRETEKLEETVKSQDKEIERRKAEYENRRNELERRRAEQKEREKAKERRENRRKVGK